MVLVYDRPLLRSAARDYVALKAINDRFAIGLQEHGSEHPGSTELAMRRSNREM